MTTQDARRQSLHRNRVTSERTAIDNARTERTARSLITLAGAVIATIAGLAVIAAPHAGAVISSFTH